MQLKVHQELLRRHARAPTVVQRGHCVREDYKEQATFVTGPVIIADNDFFIK